MRTIGLLAVRTPSLHPSDSVGKAAELLRASTVKAVPVAADGRLVGLVTPESISELLAQPELPPDRARVGDLAFESYVVLPEAMSAAAALEVFRANGLRHAPVLDSLGGVIGVVGEAELASAVCGRIRPPIIGGMATPFGVYLTGGGVRGGVGDFALMSTGMYLGLLSVVAELVSAQLLSPDGWLDRWLTSGPTLAMVPVPLLQMLLMFGMFGLLFRLSWVTGFHAAEHQVVHAIEAGDDLLPEIVRAKPRVHPRCGTNLVAGVMVASTVWWLNPILGDLVPVLTLVATLYFWRRLGGVLQQYVTTRPATLRQLENGIAAGQELMEKYQVQPGERLSFPRRVWNMGILQVFSGFATLFALLALIQWLVPLPFRLVEF
ncbi:MAG: DUF1385 domain-containing protein [Armatimonadota bacterium]